MFGRKATAADVMKLFAQLPDDEKAKVLDGLKQPETKDEEQIAEAEEHIEESGEENGTKDQTEKDIEDESVGEQEHLDGNEDSQPAEERIAESEGEEAAEEAGEAPAEEVPAEEDAQSAENGEEVIAKLAERVSALEEALKGYDELKAQMEDFTAKQAEKFGYKGRPFGERKSWDDMNAAEMKEKILNGEI